MHETIPEPADVPVMASALQRRSFELCGAEADGAISWVCPGGYLRDVAIPAMNAKTSTYWVAESGAPTEGATIWLST